MKDSSLFRPEIGGRNSPHFFSACIHTYLRFTDVDLCFFKDVWQHSEGQSLLVLVTGGRHIEMYVGLEIENPGSEHRL